MEKKRARIVIVGGGFGGLFTALDLGGAADVTLVSDEDHFLFTPMLYEYFSGEVEEWHIAPKFNELLDNQVHLVRGAVTDIDLETQTVSVDLAKQGPGIQEKSGTLNYDILVLAVGG